MTLTKPDRIMQGNHPGEVLLQYEARDGRPRRVESYHLTRAGVSWPGADCPGYYCIFGLKNAPSISQSPPIELLDEGEHSILEKFFEHMILQSNRYRCESMFANLEKREGYLDSLRRFVRERKLEMPRLLDSSVFENLNYGVALIKQRIIDDELVASKGSILGRQVGSITPDDLRERPEDRFYAVMALVRLLCSLEHYPWKKERTGFVGFTNIMYRTRGTKTNDQGYQ
jgi:hypothetical protein